MTENVEMTSEEWYSEPIVRFDEELPEAFLITKPDGSLMYPIVERYARTIDYVAGYNLDTHYEKLMNIMRSRSLAGSSDVLNPRQVSSGIMSDNDYRGQVIQIWQEVQRVHDMFKTSHTTFGDWLWDNAKELRGENLKITIDDKNAAVGLVKGEGNHYLGKLNYLLDVCRRLAGQVDSTGFAYKDSIEALKRNRDMEIK